MKARLLILFSICVITCSCSQEKKWNVEANYTLVPADGIFGEDNFIDVGVKYRFAKLGLFDFGFGVNGGFSRVNVENTGFESRTDDTYLIQPRFFTEVQIPGVTKFRPSLGLGYSFVNTVSNFTTTNGIEDSNNGWTQGFNLNLGLSYDFSKRFFLQAQYDFIDLTPDDGLSGNINNIRLGLGFRF